MFENPGDIMSQKKEEPLYTATALQAVMDIDELHQPVLPHFFQEGQPDSIPRISKDTLVNILEGKYDLSYTKRMIIDCRFEYEYEGGHITGAVNYNDKEMLTTQLFEDNAPGKTLLVFHCEYSAHRAPIMARHVRQQDRATNAEQYPKLTYPEVYILDGGYSGFFTEFRDRCFPQNYVEMDDKNHIFTCEREMGKLRQNRGKLGRAQTFAFGSQGLDDSPTATNRACRANDTMMLDSSPISSNNRVHARRMASY
jgi:M-phase inducer tyrosine phosphatase